MFISCVFLFMFHEETFWNLASGLFICGTQKVLRVFRALTHISIDIDLSREVGKVNFWENYPFQCLV